MRRQSQAQITGRDGERWFSSILPPEWSIQRPVDDFGTDGIVAIGNKEHMTPLEFGVQIKSSKDLKSVKKCVVSPKIERDAVLYWCQKFIPTLIILYDTSRKVGYFEWTHNLVSVSDIDSGRSSFYLHIDQQREINAECWSVIEAELDSVHRQWASALSFNRENLPAAGNLATLLKYLCHSRLLDRTDEMQAMGFNLLQVRTHEEVIRRLDQLIPKVDPSSSLVLNLRVFRDEYHKICHTVIDGFSPENSDSKLVHVKADAVAEHLLNVLAAMLAECVSGLLGHVGQND